MNEGLPSSISIILNQMSALLFHWSHRRPLQLLWRQSDIDGQAFLLQRPDGAYTTMRTLVGGRRIFDWQMHADRLFTSSIVPISQPKEMFQLSMTVLIQRALQVARDKISGDLKLTMLLCENTEEGEFHANGDVSMENVSIASDISLHITSLVRLDEVLNQVQVEVRGSPRHDPNRKSTEYCNYKILPEFKCF